MSVEYSEWEYELIVGLYPLCLASVDESHLKRMLHETAYFGYRETTDHLFYANCMRSWIDFWKWEPTVRVFDHLDRDFFIAVWSYMSSFPSGCLAMTDSSSRQVSYPFDEWFTQPLDHTTKIDMLVFRLWLGWTWMAMRLVLREHNNWQKHWKWIR